MIIFSNFISTFLLSVFLIILSVFKIKDQYQTKVFDDQYLMISILIKKSVLEWSLQVLKSYSSLSVYKKNVYKIGIPIKNYKWEYA